MAADDVMLDPKQVKKEIREERKALKQEQSRQRKEARARAKEISAREEDIDDGDAGRLSVAMVTIVIIVIWLAILALLIKLDVMNFGSEIMRPILKDVPVLNAILPAGSSLGGDIEDGEAVAGRFDNLDDALAYIGQLEYELEVAKSSTNNDSARVEELEAEIKRLKTFEDSQVEFERIKNEFYQEVIYAENAPSIEEYKKYYESIDPEKAEALYQQVVAQSSTDKEIRDYVAAYSAMKPKEAAGIFEAMTDNLSLAARILENMDSTSRGKILGAMDADVAAKITKLMDPEY